MLEQYEKKKSEYQEWSSVVEQAVSQKDAAAKEAVQVFQKIKKHVFRCTLSQMRGSRGFDLLNNYCLCTSAHAKKLLFVLGCLSNLHTHTCTVCCSSCLGAHRCCMAQRKRKCSMRCSLLCCLHATSYACLSCNSAYSLSKQSESSTSPSCVHQHACLHLQQASRSLWQHCSPSVSDIAKNGVWQDCFSVQCFASKVPTHGYCGAGRLGQRRKGVRTRLMRSWQSCAARGGCSQRPCPSWKSRLVRSCWSCWPSLTGATVTSLKWTAATSPPTLPLSALAQPPPTPPTTPPPPRPPTLHHPICLCFTTSVSMFQSNKRAD